MNSRRQLSMLMGLGLVLNGCSNHPVQTAQSPTYETLSWMESLETGERESYRLTASERAKTKEEPPDIDLSAKIDAEVQKEIGTAALGPYLDELAKASTTGKSQSIESKLKAVIAQHPEEKRAHFLLGIHYMRTKKKELASHFFHLVEKDPQFQWQSLLYNNLGMLSLQDKDRDQAIVNFEKAVAAQPMIAAPRVNLGSLYLQSKSYNDALPLFSKALEIDPHFEEAALGLGVCLESQGKFEEAHKMYSQFMENHPTSIAVLYNDAVILGKRLGKKEEARELMLRYIQKGGKETAKAHEMIQGWR